MYIGVRYMNLFMPQKRVVPNNLNSVGKCFDMEILFVLAGVIYSRGIWPV